MGQILEKTLSPNDVGATGAHQAGVLIPKRPEALAAFPRLGTHELNPRRVLNGVDEAGTSWPLNFIYYNNFFFGGTRNEFRVTGVGPYLRSRHATAGDVLQLEMCDDDTYRLTLVRRSIPASSHVGGDQVVRIRLTSSWRLVKW